MVYYPIELLRDNYMECSIEGCYRNAPYKSLKICTLHYKRLQRNGHYEKVRTVKYRLTNADGYQILFEPNHHLSDCNGYVYEHRLVVFNRYGEVLPDCELCEKSLNWVNCFIDHVDEDKSNNKEGNLRPCCPACNTMRGRIKKPEHIHKNHYPITFNGKTQTAEEWSRESSIKLSGAGILKRLARGMSIEDALLSPRKTCQTVDTKVKVMRKWSA